MHRSPRTTLPTRVLLVLTPIVLVVAVLVVLMGGDRPADRDDAPQIARGTADPAPEGRCEGGWRQPEPGTSLYDQPLRIIRRTMQVEGDFDVEEMRYFVGPESPPSDKNYLARVRRWYVKGSLAEDPSFRGRWLVEARRFGAGVAAVAPYDTTGFQSPEWTGFQYETVGPESEPRPYPGLPGEWVGSPYDFVTGEEPDEDVPGEAMTIPGLPEEVVGCLEGT